jgi:chitin-binding protein
MKNRTQIVLSILTSLALVIGLPSVYAFAKDNNQNSEGEDHRPAFVNQKLSQKENNGNNGNRGVNRSESGFEHSQSPNLQRPSDQDDDDSTITPPIQKLAITQTQISSLSTTSVVISWKTNKLTSGSVMYGTTSSAATVGGTVVMDTATNTISHSVKLSGLTPNKTYFYTITAVDASNQKTTSRVMSFKTKEVVTVNRVAPVIWTYLSLNLSSTSERIIWLTSQPSNSNIWLSTTTPVVATGTPSASISTNSYLHDVTLTSLKPGTTYYYILSSTNGNGTATSTNYTFSTPSS